jgi:hypothetical protein
MLSRALSAFPLENPLEANDLSSYSQSAKNVTEAGVNFIRLPQ